MSDRDLNHATFPCALGRWDRGPYNLNNVNFTDTLALTETGLEAQHNSAMGIVYRTYIPYSKVFVFRIDFPARDTFGYRIAINDPRNYGDGYRMEISHLDILFAPGSVDSVQRIEQVLKAKIS